MSSQDKNLNPNPCSKSNGTLGTYKEIINLHNYSTSAHHDESLNGEVENDPFTCHFSLIRQYRITTKILNLMTKVDTFKKCQEAHLQP